MTWIATKALYKIIQENVLQGLSRKHNPKRNEDAKRHIQTADLFENAILDAAPEGVEDSCFLAAVRYHDTMVVELIFQSYNSRNDRVIDFSQKAIIKLPNYTINLLQYAFKYGDEATFKTCCEYIKQRWGDEEVKRLLNSPIKKILSDGTTIITSIWEDAIFSLNLQRLVSDPLNTIDGTKYDKHTFDYLVEFFENWKHYSQFADVNTKPSLVDQWKEYAKRHNLPANNDALERPVELRINTHFQFATPVKKRYIDLEYVSPITGLNLTEVVEMLAPEDDSLREYDWENVIKPLISLHAEGSIEPIFDEDLPSEPSVSATLTANIVGHPSLAPIKTRTSINCHVLKARLKSQREEVNEEFQRRLRAHSMRLERHSGEIQQQQESINELFDKAYHSVETRITDYARSKEHSDIAKDCFQIVALRTINHDKLFGLALDELLTVNTVSDASKIAKIGGQVLKFATSLVPGQGAEFISNVYEVGMDYITRKHLHKQAEAVFATSIKVQLPLLLLELSESVAKILEIRAKSLESNTDLDADSISAEMQRIAIATAIAVNKKINNLHKEIKENGIPTEDVLRAMLFEQAANTIECEATDKKSNRPVMLHARPVGSHSSAGSASSGSQAYSPGGTPDPKAQKRKPNSKGGSGCVIS